MIAGAWTGLVNLGGFLGGIEMTCLRVVSSPARPRVKPFPSQPMSISVVVKKLARPPVLEPAFFLPMSKFGTSRRLDREHSFGRRQAGAQACASTADSVTSRLQIAASFRSQAVLLVGSEPHRREWRRRWMRE